MQETLRRHPDRGTWTPFISWKPYIQSDRFFCIRGVGQPQVGPHFLRNTGKYLPFIYWIPKNTSIHINIDSLQVHRSVRPSLYPFYSHIKQGLQKYCETAYSRSGINQMWILKNSKELLDHLKSPNFNLITNIKSFDFSTLNTTLPNHKLKSRLASIIRNAFLHKNGNRRYKYLVLGREGPYFVKRKRKRSDSVL